jgi:hypothetical protein
LIISYICAKISNVIIQAFEEHIVQNQAQVGKLSFNLLRALEDLYGFHTLMGQEWRIANSSPLCDIPESDLRTLVDLGLAVDFVFPEPEEIERQRKDAIGAGQWTPVHQANYEQVIQFMMASPSHHLAYYKLSEAGWTAARECRAEGKFHMFPPVV